MANKDTATTWQTIERQITDALPDYAAVPVAQIQELVLMMHYQGNRPGKGATEAEEAPEAYAAAKEKARAVLFSWINDADAVKGRAEFMLTNDTEKPGHKARSLIVAGKVVQTTYTAAGKSLLQLLTADLFFPWALECISATRSIIDKGPEYVHALATLNRATGILFDELTEDKGLNRAAAEAIKRLFPVELVETDAVPVDIQGRGLLPSSKELQFALTTRDNDNAFITRLESDFMDYLQEAGEFYLMIPGEEETASRKIKEGVKRVPLESVQLVSSLYGSLLNALQIKAPEDIEQMRGKNLVISLPELARAFGVDYKPLKSVSREMKTGEEISAKRADISVLLTGASFIWGDVKRESAFYPVLTIQKWDYGHEQIEITAPYLWYLYDQTIGKAKKDAEKGKREGFYYTQLISPRRVGKNYYAQEIARRLVLRLQQHGTTQDDAKQSKKKEDRGRFTVRESYADIITDVPQLKDSINRPDQRTSDANKSLQRAFSADKIVEALEQGTDACGFYSDFTITFEGPAGMKTPTVKAAGKWYIVARHTGREKDYREGLRTRSLLPVKDQPGTWAAVEGVYNHADFVAVKNGAKYEARPVV